MKTLSSNLSRVSTPLLSFLATTFLLTSASNFIAPSPAQAQFSLPGLGDRIFKKLEGEVEGTINNGIKGTFDCLNGNCSNQSAQQNPGNIADSKTQLVQQLLSSRKCIGCDLSGVNLRGATLVGADLSNAKLEGVDLSGANLNGAYLRGSDLSRADLSRADLSRANLKNANLTNADLNRANLNYADLTNAILQGADLLETKMVGTDLRRATMPDGKTTSAASK